MEPIEEQKRIKIAYITADWNRELVSVALGSLMDFLNANPNISVQVFNCFGFTLHSEDSSFRYKIYDLADFRNYDAAIIQAHQIMDDFCLRELGRRIREAGIPAISIGAEMEGCLCIGTDDYTASRYMAEHLITVHGAKTFIYLKGYEHGDEGEAYARRRAFEDVCREHGIPEENIIYRVGEWQSEKGAEQIREYLESGAPLPDAIVSANDEMALGALGVLKDAGIRVPQDVLVTGYDDIFSASLSDPRLSTIQRRFNEIIRNACEALLKKLDGKDVPDKLYEPFEPVFSESCGCRLHSASELLTIRRMFYMHQRRLESFYYMQDKLTAGFFAAKNPMEILDVMERYSGIFGSPRMYLYLNDYYADMILGQDGNSRPAAESDMRDFSDKLVLMGYAGGAMGHDGTHVYMRISRGNLTEAALLKKERFGIFYPLFFEGMLMGFMVLTKPPTVTEMNLHESVVNQLVFAIENTRQKTLTEKLNDKLTALSVTDPLTGLYNRFGYEKFANELFADIRERGSRIRVLFLDVDNMKQINDEHGHESGDLALRAISRVIRDSCRKSDFKMRYGGDEFVIITEACDADIKGRIEQSLEKYNSSGELPFPLHASVGDYLTAAAAGETLDDLLTRADELMYKEKTCKKRAAFGK